MIGSLLSSLFGGQKEEETLQVDDKLALAVLLVRAGYADGEYCGAEQDRTERILAAWFDLSPAEVKELRIEAEQVEADVVDNVSFTRVLKEIVPFDEREAVVEALWEIVLADQSRDSGEDGFMRLAAKLLGVNDRDSALARQRVIAGME